MPRITSAPCRSERRCGAYVDSLVTLRDRVVSPSRRSCGRRPRETARRSLCVTGCAARHQRSSRRAAAAVLVGVMAVALSVSTAQLAGATLVCCRGPLPAQRRERRHHRCSTGRITANWSAMGIGNLKTNQASIQCIERDGQAASLLAALVAFRLIETAGARRRSSIYSSVSRPARFWPPWRGGRVPPQDRPVVPRVDVNSAQPSAYHRGANRSGTPRRCATSSTAWPRRLAPERERWRGSRSRDRATILSQRQRDVHPAPAAPHASRKPEVGAGGGHQTTAAFAAGAVGDQRSGDDSRDCRGPYRCHSFRGDR